MVSKILVILALSVASAWSLASAQDYILFNGGIGLEERAQAPTTGVRLVFFEKSGDFRTNVDVTIKNQAGEAIIHTVTQGPWLILDLPPGSYQVHAQLDADNAQGGVITVDGTAQEFAYMFQVE